MHCVGVLIEYFIVILFVQFNFSKFNRRSIILAVSEDTRGTVVVHERLSLFRLIRLHINARAFIYNSFCDTVNVQSAKS